MRPPEQFKSLASRIAQLANSKEGRNALLLLRWSNLLAGEEDNAKAAAHQAGGITDPLRDSKPLERATRPDRTGIWERTTGGSFVRAMDLFPEWGLWASVGRIEKKSKKLRVALIGESVARGYLYDPQFNPAMVLEKILQRQLGNQAVEVVDLARTNLGFEVEELTVSALLLEPDAVVIFSGNNWSLARLHRRSDIPYIDAALRDQGITGLKRFVEQRLEERVRGVVAAVSSVYQRRRVPLIWVIPEFNLGDWRDPFSNAAYLPGVVNSEWIKLWEACERHIEKGDLGSASVSARKMAELDNGTNPAALYILAEFNRSLGNTDEARRYFELARDATIWDPSQYFSPRVHSVTQRTLREAAGRSRHELIDLPTVFQDYLGGDLPDRRLFLDYCHLASDGINVAAAAMASGVLKALKGVDVPWRELMNFCVSPGSELEAETAFLAAIHNAHFWQHREVVEHHCVRAIQSSRNVAKLMLLFADLQLRNIPMLMSRTAEEFAAQASPSIQNYILGHCNQQLDLILLDCIVTALKGLGIDCRQRFEDLLRSEHSVSINQINLLDYYYCSAALQAKEVVWVTPREGFHTERLSSYYKAYWIESKFIFVAQAECPVTLRLVCRLPSVERAPVSITVNGTNLGTFSGTPTWESWNIEVAGETVRDGINEVVVHWPMLAAAPGRPFEYVAEDLTGGFGPEFFQVFGEIHSFVAAPVEEPQ